MLDDSIKIENMSYLAGTFPLIREDKEDSVHPTQLGKRKVKVQLLFLIPGNQGEEGTPRVASVKVPKGVPVAKLRLLIRHCESALQDTYGKAKRLNFIMMTDEEEENWTYEFDLPVFGVVYV